MISGIFGAGTVAANLRGGLNELSATHRTIAGRLADASQASASDFNSQLAGAAEAISEEEILQQMAALADTQLRFEATARLLQKAYTDVRTAVRNG